MSEDAEMKEEALSVLINYIVDFYTIYEFTSIAWKCKWLIWYDQMGVHGYGKTKIKQY